MAFNTNERVFVLGATGNVGSQVVKELLTKNVAVTAYVRNTDKAAELFANPAGALTIVQGDINDLSPLKKALPGHTRLFLMVSDLRDMVSLKTEIATLAYAAGVKQIVDLSCSTFNLPLRTNYIAKIHIDSEDAILNIPHRGHAVSLRPTRFMSNVTKRFPRGFEHFEDSIEPNCPQSWISPNDIAAVAATVLTGSIEDHDDNVYELTSQVATPSEVAQTLTRVTGRTITYKRVSALDRYNTLNALSQYPFAAAYDLATMIEVEPRVALGISVLLGREPEGLEAYFNANKQDLVV